VFHADIAKVDRDVVYVAMIVHVCCKLLFPMFHLFFPHVCCKCVYLDVTYVSYILQVFLSRCYICFTIVFKCFSCIFCKCFR
jgi:hypothetical protein